MQKISFWGLLCCCLIGAVTLAHAGGTNKNIGKITKFAQFPNKVKFPEGITANSRGEIIVGTFDNGGGENRLIRYARNGNYIAKKLFGPTPLLGLAYNPTDDKIYICNFGNSAIQRIAANFTINTAIESVAAVTQIGPPTDRIVQNPDSTQDAINFGNTFPAPNALTFAANGDLYFSDSFQGAVFAIANPAQCSENCEVSLLVQDPLLATAGFPPFGANGLALSRDEQHLFIANTGDDRILRIDLTTLEVEVFTESVNGADGLIMDRNGLLLATANQADELVAIDQNGKVVAKYGETSSLSRHGKNDGLLFPASLVRVGRFVYVTNLALPFTDAPADEPEDKVQPHWISKIRLP